MAYEQPNIKVYQEFVPTPTTATQVQYVGVVAPHYWVFEDLALGKDVEYNDSTGIPATKYPKPEDWEETATGVVDTDTASIIMQDGVLSYLIDTYESNSDSGATYPKVTLTNGNKITLTKVLAGADRYIGLGERDVQIGDYVRFKVSSGDEYTAAKITKIEAVPTAASIGAVSRYDSMSDSTPTPSFTGTYKGSKSDTYIIAITTGGTLGSGTGSVAVQLTSVNGNLEGFQTLLFEGTGSQTLGTTGLSLSLGAGTYATGATFTCQITAANDGEKRVICIDTLIPVAANTALDTVELGAFLDFIVDPGSVEYTATTVGIGAHLLENTKLLSNTAADYPVIGGTPLISYRERVTKYSKAVQVATQEDYATVVGNISVQNPLGAMVAAAIATGGENVYFVATESDTVDGYAKAFEVLAGTPEAYSIVLHSMDKDIITSAMTFVSAQSAPAVSNYRILWYGLDDDVNVARYTKTATGVDIRVSGEDGLVTSATSGVNFESAGVQIGDILRINYATDSDGQVTYDEYTITGVAATTLDIDGAPDFLVPVRAEIWQKLRSNDALVSHMVSEVATADRRAYAVYGDGITIGGITDAPSWVLAAAAAGMRAGNYAQAPLTNRTYSATANPVHDFTVAQLNKLAERGVWLIVTNNDGVVYNRHQLSTDMSDLKMREQSYTTALDQISKGVRAIFSVYHGISNISPDLINQLMADTTTYLSQQVSVVPNITVGSLLKSYDNLTIYQDEVDLDHLWMTVDYELQAPFNFATITQRVL